MLLVKPGTRTNVNVRWRLECDFCAAAEWRSPRHWWKWLLMELMMMVKLGLLLAAQHFILQILPPLKICRKTIFKIQLKSKKMKTFLRGSRELKMKI